MYSPGMPMQMAGQLSTPPHWQPRRPNPMYASSLGAVAITLPTIRVCANLDQRLGRGH